jgi:hypothetical protein
MKIKLIFTSALFTAVTATCVQAQSWNQKGSDINGEAADDRSGISVSMPDAKTIAIGAYWNDGHGSYSGQVRIYSWNLLTGGWVPKRNGH